MFISGRRGLGAAITMFACAGAAVWNRRSHKPHEAALSGVRSYGLCLVLRVLRSEMYADGDVLSSPEKYVGASQDGSEEPAVSKVDTLQVGLAKSVSECYARWDDSLFPTSPYRVNGLR
jgi:hypothetical protein